jgi:antitoxin component YwqK of YwqJK toxin-antitoxin module
MKRFRHTIIFLLLYSRLAAQSDTVFYYFDENLNACTQKEASIIGKGVTKKGKFDFIAIKTSTNIPLFTGIFSDSTLASKEGLFTYYDDAGKKESEGVYDKNVETGQWIIWKEGIVSDSILFEKGQNLEHIALGYHEGKLVSRTFIDARKNSTETIEWYTTEKERVIKSKLTVKGENGEDIQYYNNGQIASITLLKGAKVLSEKRFNKDGIEITKGSGKKNEPNINPAQPPTYPGGTAAFMDFFKRNFNAPKSLDLTGQTVTISFMLDKAGFAYDIKVSGSSDRTVEIEVLSVVRKMSPWTMNGYPQYGPVTYHINL